MSENIRWQVDMHPVPPGLGVGSTSFEDEPFGVAIVPGVAGSEAFILTKKPYFEEKTHDPALTPRETQIFAARKPKKGGKGDRKRRVVQG